MNWIDNLMKFVCTFLVIGVLINCSEKPVQWTCGQKFMYAPRGIGVFYLDKVLNKDIQQFCVYEKTDKILESTYPFDKADKIEAISYTGYYEGNYDAKLIRDGNFIVKEINERIELNSIQIDTLFSILYEYKRKGIPKEFHTKSYFPRYVFVFSAEGVAIEYLELDLQGEAKQSTPQIFGEFCFDKMNQLDNLLRSVGIKH